MPVADAILTNKSTAGHGTLVMAEEQTAGIGRRAREWKSSPKGNL